MNRLLLGSCVLAATFAMGTLPAAATVTDHGTVRTFTTSGPEIVTDVTCQEGEPYLVTGSEAITVHFVEAEEGLHVSVHEHHEGTAVPVDGTGLTYVENGNTDHRVVNVNFVNGFVVFSFVNNDSFVAYRDGKLDASSTLRIHEQEQFVGVDTDGDGVPDVVRVQFSKSRFSSCP
jgi:hypothetical protein